MAKTFEGRIDIKSTAVKLFGTVVQNDTGANKFIIRLADGTTPYNLNNAGTVTVTVLKSDNTKCVDTAEITDRENGEITYTLHDKAINIVGMCIATIEVFEGNTRLTTAKLGYEVLAEIAVDDSQVESSDELPVLERLITEQNSINAQANENEAARQANEDLRIQNELNRQEAYENAIANLVSPDITIKTNTSTEYVLHVKDVNGEFDTPNLRGKDGTSGSNGTNGVNGRDGMSAYAYAIAGGYTKDESTFYSDLASLDWLAQVLGAI